MRKIEWFLFITLCAIVAAGAPTYEKLSRDKRRAEILVISPPEKVAAECSEKPKKEVKRELLDDDEELNFEDNYEGN